HAMDRLLATPMIRPRFPFMSMVIACSPFVKTGLRWIGGRGQDVVERGRAGELLSSDGVHALSAAPYVTAAPSGHRPVFGSDHKIGF
ncbi:MAG: hypothetical protein ACSHW1_18755, partial [Yoonia sp.]|uniref:hypothetical protein n=1 Tax=Yoonia sp. TaxID=2212373 RepID=UPI003EF946D5